MESVYYLEPMKLSESYKADYSLDPDIHSQETIASQVYFVPVIDENGYQANGAIMILVPNSTATGYMNLLRTIFISAAVIFLGIMLVITFTRDPITGFMVLALFGVVVIFIAYPLLEAVRLSFMKDGVVSLQTWKETLSPTYLVALWVHYASACLPPRSQPSLATCCLPYRKDLLHAKKVMSTWQPCLSYHRLSR